MDFDVFLIWLKIIKTPLFALEKILFLSNVTLALRPEGYKLTDRNHQEKWEIVIEKLKMKPEFADLEIQPMALKNQFSRMQKD
jgi:hypothetical protein